LVQHEPIRFRHGMGGNASSSLGSGDHHGLRDNDSFLMRSMGTDDRPTERDEDTNRKSMFPVPKTPHKNIPERHRRTDDLLSHNRALRSIAR